MHKSYLFCLCLLSLFVIGCSNRPDTPPAQEQGRVETEQNRTVTSVATEIAQGTDVPPTAVPIIEPTAVVAAPSELPARPNIILLMTDDQGWGETGYMNHPHALTPNLDQMAANGLVFTHFYATAPICSPTRVSILTGRHPYRTGCMDVMGCTLDTTEITIAQQLQTAGYATGHFGKWHIGRFGGRNAVTPGMSGFDTWVSAPRFFDIGDDTFVRNGTSIPPIEIDTSEFIVTEALQFIEENVAADQPFFTVIWYAAPHTPWDAMPEDRAPFADLSEDAQNYYGELYGMDRSLGLLRSALQEWGIADNTVLWFNSDNGAANRIPADGVAGLSGQKGSLQEGGIRVPAVIEWPSGITSRFVTDTPAGTLDIYPTLLELAGIESGLALDGISLVPLLKGEMETRPVPIPFWYERNLLEFTAQELGTSVWLDYPYKLHKTVTAEGTHYELYDLAADPAEQNDLAAQEAEIVNRLAAAQTAWQADVWQDFTSR